MPRKGIAQLLAEITAETAELETLTDRRDGLRAQLTEVSKEVRAVGARRERRIVSARKAGAAVADISGAAGVTPGRIRQLAPLPKRGAAPVRAAAEEHPADHHQEVAEEH